MGTDKRERQKANRQKKLEEMHRAEQKNDIRGRVILFVTIGLLVFGGLFIWSLSGGDDTDTAAGEAAAEATDTAETTTTIVDEDAEAAAEPAAPECPPAEGSDTQVLEFASAPEMCIDVAKTYTADVSTSMGDFTIELDAERAPLTVNNFVFLARYGYYDGATFHRVIPGFVIQGGDPVGNPPGTGGPGYSFDDELPEAGEYELGSLAMANSGTNTNGSQFFVITGDQGQALPPQYSLFGKVSEGLDVALSIQDVETDGGDAPVEPVVIESVTITES